MFVSIRADQGQLDKALGGIHGQLTKGDVAAGSFFGNIAAGVARAAMGLGKGLFDATIKSASNLNETLSKVGTVFGPSTKLVTDQTDDMAKRFGLLKQPLLDASATLGLFAQGAGQSGEKSAEFSNHMVKLATDAMSFYNVPLESALEKIRAGLSGESEPLRAFGVFLTEDAVKAEAMAMGLGKGHKTLTEGEKVMARAALITKGLAVATGDLDRTFSGTENQSRSFWGTLANLGTTIGATLLPAYDRLLAAGNWLAGSMATVWESMKGPVAGFLDSVMGGFTAFQGAVAGVLDYFGPMNVVLGAGTVALIAFSPAIYAAGAALVAAGLGTVAAWFPVLALVAGAALGFKLVSDNAAFFQPLTDQVTAFGGAVKEWMLDKLDLVGILWRNLPDFVAVAAIQIYEKILNIGEYFMTIPGNLALIGDYIQNNWREIIVDSVSFVGTVFTNLGTNIGDLFTAIKGWFQGKGFDFKWTGLTENFEATAAQLPEMLKPHLTSLQDQVDAKLATIGQKTISQAIYADLDAGLFDSEELLPVKGKKDPAKATDEAKKPAKEFKAELTGSAEFASKLRLAQFSGDDTPRDQLAEQKKTNDFLAEIALAMGDPTMALLG